MANFMQFTAKNGKPVFINRDFITDFSYNEDLDRTIVALPGNSENYIEVQGDQTQRILDVWREI